MQDCFFVAACLEVKYVVSCKYMKPTNDIATIKKMVLPILKPYRVTRAGLFGSFARGEATAKSDVDILVEIGKPIGLFEFIRLERKLEEVLGRRVDLVEHSTLKPRIKPYVMKDYLSLL